MTRCRRSVCGGVLAALILNGGPGTPRTFAEPPASAGSDQTILRSYLAGNGLLNRGLHDLAAAEYRKFLSEHGDHEKAPVARYGLAVCLFRTERYDGAIVELVPLQQAAGFEYAAESATILGQCHLARKEYAAAVPVFDRVVRDFGDHELGDDAAAGAAEALHLHGQHAKAVARAEAFASRWPASPLRNRVEYLAAVSEMSLGDHGSAAQRLNELLRRHPESELARRVTLLLAQCHHHTGALDEAEQRYRQLLEGDGDAAPPEVLFGLAGVLLPQGSVKEAGDLLDRLLRRFPDSSLRASARLLRGRAWFEQKQFDRALAEFENLTDDEEHAAEAAYWAAKCRLQQGHFADAAERLRRAAEEFADSGLLAEMYYDRGVALVRAGELTAADKVFSEFRARFPEHALAGEALRLLALVAHQQGQFEKSGAHCRSFLAEHAAHEQAAAVLFLSGENEFLEGRYGEASAAYCLFLGRYPGDPRAPQAKHRLGMSLYRVGKFDEAEPLLTEASERASSDALCRPSLLALGDIWFHRGEWERAEQHLGAYLSLDERAPGADDALLKLGLAQQRRGRHAEALASFDRLLDRFAQSPHRLHAAFEKGQTLVSLGRFEPAEEAFRGVLSESGESRFAPHALKHLGGIAMQGRRFDQAAGFFDRAALLAPDEQFRADARFQQGQALLAGGQFKDAEDVLARVVERSPSHDRAAQAAAHRAIALARQNRAADALESLEGVERDFSDRLDSSLLAAARYEKAWCLRELGRADEAAELYRRLVGQSEAGALNVHALLELAGLEAAAGRHEAAAGLLKRLRVLGAGSAETVPADVAEHAVYRLGVCEFELRHYEEAAKLFEELLERFPDSTLAASACFYCGEALFHIGRFERAVIHLTRVAERFESDEVCGPSLLRLGECLAGLQRWARAEEAFRRYLGRFADSPAWYQARFGLGWTLENQRRFDEAINAYQAVVDRHQGETAARAQFQIGECLFARKQYDEAAREFLKVEILYAYPEWSAAALYEAGRCFEKLSKPVEARGQFKRVADEYGQTRWAELASQRLAEVAGGGLPGR